MENSCTVILTSQIMSVCEHECFASRTDPNLCLQCMQGGMFPLVPIARAAGLQAEAAVRAVPLPAAPGTLMLGIAASVTGVQVRSNHY